jgi:DNA polymerase
MLHPAFLLRSPEQKRLAWRDWLQLKAKVESLHANMAL